MGYEDLKAIEAYNFLQSIVDGQQREPSFRSARDLVFVQQAMIRSWRVGVGEGDAA
ncbi:MAG: hypothetical protein R3A10_07630 [Caldilineaceae bacterium]